MARLGRGIPRRFAPALVVSGSGPTKVADRGSTADDIAGTSSGVTLTSPTAITPSNYLFARLALDNTGASGVATTLSVTDPRSNSWTVLGPANVDPGAASAGATAYIAYAKVGTAYQGGDALTFNYGNSTAAKAIVVEEWTGISQLSDPVAVAAQTATGTSTTPSVGITPSAATQLVYGCLATEGPAGDTFTADSDTTNGSWAALTRAASANGTAASNQTVAGQYKVVTASGAQTWDVTITSRDWAQLVVVFGPGSVAQAGHASGTGVANDATVSIADATDAVAGHAAGTGAAHDPGIVADSNVSAGHASGTGGANDATVSTAGATNAAAGHAAGTGQAFAAVAAVAPPVGHAAGSGAAGGVTVNVSPAAGHAAGTGAAGAPTANVQPAAGHATGTGAAHTATIAITFAAGQASGTGTASAATINVTPAAGHASGTGAAGAATANVQPAAGHASGAGAALAPTANVQPAAGHASGTGQALAPTINVTPAAGHAAGTGAAGAASVSTTGSTNAQAGHAAGSGAAFDAAVTTAQPAAAGHAAGTGAALQPVAAVGASAGHAAGSGLALAPELTIVIRPGVAAGIGTAYNAAASDGGVVNATATPGVATGVGRAYHPTVSIQNLRTNAGWHQLLALLQSARDVDDDLERLNCPRCGIRYDVNTRGEMSCRFDGFRPSQTAAGAPASAPSGAGRRDWGGLAAALDYLPGWGPTR